MATHFLYSCLENPMARGAWRAAVHEVAKNRTQLSMHLHTHAYTHTHTHRDTHTGILKPSMIFMEDYFLNI